MSEEISKSALLENEEMDWSINRTLKVICALIFGSVSLLLWIGYSTPNTINVCILWMGSVTLNLVIFQVSGAWIGWLIGLSISFLEYGSILAFLWKRRWYFIVSLLLTMFISTYASYKFNQFSEQSNKMKEDTIDAHENIVDNYNKLIASQDTTITGRKDYIRYTLPRLRDKYIQQKGYEPDFIAFRERQALESIDKAIVLKKVYSDSLNKYTFKTIRVKKEAGYIVRFSDSEIGSARGSLTGAIVLEIFLVFCGVIAIGFFNSSIQDAKRGFKLFVGKDGKLKSKTQGKEKRKEFVKEPSKENSITKIFAGKDNGNAKVKSQIEKDSLRSPIVKEWFAQLNDIQQGKRKKTNQQEIADKLQCERQNVYWHLKQEGLL